MNLDLQRQIDAICDRFEQQWRAGPAPRIEEFLTRLPDVSLARGLCELIAVEVELLREAGDAIEIGCYLSRFPDYEHAICEAFTLVDRYDTPDRTYVQTISHAAHVLDNAGGNHESVQTLTRNRVPQSLGRFQVVGELGQGSFGIVYRAIDTQLGREVALKVPRDERFRNSKQRADFVRDAKHAARLNHPGIVTIHDIATDGEWIFIVQQYMAGGDLKQRLQDGDISYTQAVTWMIPVAEAVAFAHQHHIFHRDLKPANILLDEWGQPHVADFGLAMHESEQSQHRDELVGTVAYMSPEQARGEVNRLDNRSDTWSLGVIFYEMLTGRRPFRGAPEELLEQIKYRDPRPLREIRQTVPAELERICVKCLSKSARQRYATADEFARDLRNWQISLARGDQSREPKGPARVVPKGLRAFDAKDAEFFLELLPGPRDREGLPESIRFWKVRIEETDPGQTFAVGVIHGPSGCGKSSLLKAGLLPRLASHVAPVFIESTPADTEVRLMNGLRRSFPEIPLELSLPEVFKGLRSGRWNSERKKILIVLDQFEQWLLSGNVLGPAELVDALRHCDAEHLQCVLLVREDFWTGISRFMQRLEIPLQEERNAALVDRFDPLHARRVLAEFGRAFGRLPEDLEELSPQQDEFLDAAVDQLSEEGRVICVRLALFGDMIKGKPWTRSALLQAGGAAGLGVAFLEDTFGANSAPEAHRRHAQAVRKLFRALLPDVGTNLKGQMRSHHELLEATGYVDRTQDFDDVIRILDEELRLITPTDPEGRVADGCFHGADSKQDLDTTTRYYQFTHDYLVPSVRRWLSLKQAETEQGRAELRLTERAAVWSAKPENRHLPTLWEFLKICLLTERKRWSAAENKMMTKATVVQGIRLGIVAFILVASFIGMIIRHSVVVQQNRTRAATLVRSLDNASDSEVDTILESLEEYRTWANPLLKSKFDQEQNGSRKKLLTALALLPVDKSQAVFLRDSLFTTTPGEFRIVRNALLPRPEADGAFKEIVIEPLWKVALDANLNIQQRFRAACALATYDPDDNRWMHVSAPVAVHLVSLKTSEFLAWQEALRPAHQQLIEPFRNIVRDKQQSELSQWLATFVLADYAKDDPKLLTSLLVDANPQPFSVLFPVLQEHSAAATKELQDVVTRKIAADWKDAPLDPTWRVPEQAARAAIEAAHGIMADRFAFCQDMPWQKFATIVETLRDSGYRPTRVRPYVHIKHDESTGRAEANSELLVAAIWARDGRRWSLETDLDHDQLPSAETPAQKEGLVPEDIAAYQRAATLPGELRYALLWCESNSKGEGRRVAAGLSEPRFHQIRENVSDQGFAAQNSVHVVVDAAGFRRYAAIWSNQGAPSTVVLISGGGERFDQTQWDVAVAGGLPDPFDNFRILLAEYENAPAETLDGRNLPRETRAMANHHLGNLELALADLDYLVERRGPASGFIQYRAVTLARMERADDARADLERLRASASVAAYTRILVSAWLGEFERAMSELEQATAEIENKEAADFYNLADAAALSSHLCAEKNANRSQQFKDIAIDMLGRALAPGVRNSTGPWTTNPQRVRVDPNLVSLRSDPRFAELLDHIDPHAHYAGLWRADVEFESRLITAPTLESLVEQSQELIAAGYRPFAIGVDGDISAHVSSLGLVSCVWHRPIISPAARERFAQQTATAAVALLKMSTNADLNSTPQGSPLVSEVLKQVPDPEQRSFLLHRLATYGADPQPILNDLGTESETLTRRALVLAAGEFAKADLLTAGQRQMLLSQLARLYDEDPDSGVHGAAEWALRQLGGEAEIREVRKKYATGDVVGNRQWHLTKTGQQTMIVLEANNSFLMGSPITEVGREGQETRHLRRIDRKFAIAAHEVTVEQFEEFHADNAIDRTKSRENTAPANTITWYEAAEYCNWLSKQEGIPPEQWCYDPSQPFANGMKLYDDYLHRTGYRLPTEAEWEYACRACPAQTRTAHFFGETDQLLDDYAWHRKNSLNRWMLPVGSLRPNDYGLFDTYGNALEWCQDAYGSFANEMLDQEQHGTVNDSAHRVLRGGGLDDSAASMRSASRSKAAPNIRFISLGFRVARTFN